MEPCPHSLNFLVVELKRLDDIENDIKKIKNKWMRDPWKYRFGASIVIKSKEDWKIHLFERNGNDKIIIKSSIFKDYLPPPSITPSNQSIACQIQNLVDKIFNAEKRDKNTDTAQWEREIDKLVYKLYDPLRKTK